MAIRQPIVSEIAYRTWCIDEYGMDAMFLLEGDEKLCSSILAPACSTFQSLSVS